MVRFFFAYKQGRHWCSEKFYEREGNKISAFFKRIFFGRTDLNLIRKQEKL